MSRKDLNQENLFVDLMNLDKIVNKLKDKFGQDFTELIDNGELTFEQISESIPETEKIFDEFIEYIGSLKRRSIEFMDYVVSSRSKQIEIEAKKDFDNAIAERDRLQEILNEKRKYLNSVCTCTDTEIQDDYVPGNYLDCEMYIKKRVCKVCGRVLSESCKLGGFG